MSHPLLNILDRAVFHGPDYPYFMEALKAAILDQPDRRLDNMLWVSDIGYNPHGAVRRLMLGELEPFDYATELKMKGGQALEDWNVPAAQSQLGLRSRTNVPIFNDLWSGYMDLVLTLPQDSGLIVYDHKGAAGRWWDYRGSLPRVSDCCQVLLYADMLRESLGQDQVPVYSRLYYHGWGTFADWRVKFGIIPDPNLGHVPGIIAEGIITDDKGQKISQETRYRRVNPWTLRAELETLYGRVMAGSISIEELESMNPNGPDWDYAENAYQRLRETYGDDLNRWPDVMEDWRPEEVGP